MKKTRSIFIIMLALMIGMAFSIADPEQASAISKPGKAKITSIKSVSPNAVKLKWKKVKGAKGYAIYRDGKLVKRTAAKTYTDKKLKSRTKYKYKVRAYKTYKTTKWFNKKTKKWQTKKPPKGYIGGKKKVTGYKYGKYSAEKKVTTKRHTGPLTKPEGITYTWSFVDSYPGYPGLNLKWKPVKNADYYLVYTNVAAGEAEYSDEPVCRGIRLSPGESHKLAIVAVNGADKEGPKTWITIPPRQSKYSYNVRFFSEPYSLIDIPMFIQTNNPNADNFDVAFYDSKGEEIIGWASDMIPYDDVPDTYNDFDKAKVKGGYVKTVCDMPAGTVTVKVREALKGRSVDAGEDPWAEVTIGKITIRDYETEKATWMQQVISENTDSSMTPKQKMKAIETYMRSIAKYDKTFIGNDGNSYLIFLITDYGVPEWIRCEWNSLTSPDLLVHFGALINYPLKSLYYEYPRDSEGWKQYHWYAKSTKDGSLYSFCPATTSNFYEGIHSSNDVPKVDFLNYGGYYDCY